MQTHTAFQSFRSSKWFKPALGLGGLVVIVCLALLVVPRLIDINTYRGTVASQLEQRLGRSVKLGNLSLLSLLPAVSVKVDDVAIGDDPSFASGDFLKAKTVLVQLALMPLLRGQFQVTALDLTEPQVTAINAGAGKWNWSTLKPLQNSAPEPVQPLLDMRLREGYVKLIDRNAAPVTEEVYEHVNLTLDGFSAQQAFAFKLALHLPKAAERFEVAGTVTPRPVAAANNKFTWQGQLTNLSLRVPQLKKPLENLAGDVSVGDDLCRVDNLRAQFSRSQLTGWLEIQHFDRPAMAFDLKADQVYVTEWQEALAKSEQKTAQATRTSLRAEGQLAIGKLVVNDLHCTDAQGKAVWQNETLMLDPFRVKFSGGTYQGLVRIELAGGSPDVALQGRFNELDFNQFLSATGKPSTIHGRADGSLNVRGQAGAANAFAKSLTGTGSIAIHDGKFTGFDLNKQVGVLGKLVRMPGGGGSTNFSLLKTNLRFERGKIGTSDLELVMEDVRVTGDGALQLGEPMTVDYELLAHLSAGLSKLAMPDLPIGGKAAAPITEVFSIAGSALTQTGNFFMDQSGLAVPLKLSGPIDHPNFSLNNSILQQRAATRVKERALPPLEKKPAETLKGVLDMFKKKS